MGRILVVAAVLAVVVLALDFSGVVDLFPGKPKITNDEHDPDLLGTDEPDAVALRGTGRDGVPTPDEDVPTEDVVLSEVRGTAPNGGSIRGRVVRGSAALPIAGATVMLDRPHSLIAYLRAPVNGRFDLLEAVTDDDGKFAFLELSPSNAYVVRAQHGESAVASTDSIDLRGGGHRDLGDIEIGTQGQMTGRVLSQDGTPILGAEVTVTWFSRNALQIVLTEPDLLPRIEAQVTTGEDGTFAFDALGPGTKTVIVTTPFGATDGKYKVEIEAGKTQKLGDWKLGSKHFIAGKVLWEDGTAIAGARVIAGPIGNPISRQAITDKSGAFRITNLPEAKGYGLGTLVKGLPVALKFNVPLDSDKNEVRLPMPSVLRGQVVSAESKEPVRQFSILVKRSKPTGDYLSDMVAKTVTTALGARPFDDESGEFLFEPMAAGEFDFVVSASGHATFTKKVIVVSGEPISIRIELPEGKTASGMVVDASGTGVEAEVYVFPADEPASKMPSWQLDQVLESRMPDGVSDDDGAFTLKPQTPGAYELMATAKDERPAFHGPLNLGERNITDLELKLPPSARIVGRVQGPQGQRPPDKVGVVAVFSDFTFENAMADKQGKFELKTVPVGRGIVKWAFQVEYDVFQKLRQGGDIAQAAYDKLKADSEEFSLQRGQVSRVTLTLPRRTLVNGFVRITGDKSKVRGVYWLRLPEKQRFLFCEIDDEGRFAYALVAGSYEVYIPTSSGAWLPQPVEIPDASETELELEQPRDPPK